MFYETLLAQRPDSEMAQDWCLAYGILDYDRAAVLLGEVERRKGKKSSTPIKKEQIKRDTVVEKPKLKVQKKSVIYFDEDMIADTGMGEKGMWEGIGTTGL